MKKSIALLVLAAVGGCSFQINGLDSDGGANADLAGRDLALPRRDLALADLTPLSPDLAGEVDLLEGPDLVASIDAAEQADISAVEDIAMPIDTAIPDDLTMLADTSMPADNALAVDLAVSRDLAIQPDLTVIPDLAVPPDLGVPFIPTRVTPSALHQGTADLIVNASINTQSLLVDGQVVPAGTSFNNNGSYSTLIVRNLLVQNTVKVSGLYPLIVVASESITITGLLDGTANGAVPGAGGYVGSHGNGSGKDGTGSGQDVGGGGAGYQFTGGASGFETCGNTTTPGALGGLVWGDASLALFQGGSGGGKGSVVGVCSGASPVGGAGGSVIQLTAANAVTLSGQMVAGGGGGTGGCITANSGSSSGGGGGSGGSLMIEAVVVTVSGVLAANGGGGGGAAYATLGGPGSDGKASAQPAPGGTGGFHNGSELVELRGGAGGTNSVGEASMGTTDCSKSGGGGGAPGRIYVRSRGPATLPGTISPPPKLDPNL